MPWPVHPNGLLGAQGDNDTYKVERSLRFNSGDSAYLNRTPGSAGDRKKFTISMWIKRGKLGIDSNPIFAWPGGNTLSFQILFNTSNQLEVVANIEGIANQYRLQTTQVFRDPSAWYHLVLASDTSQLTDSNRLSVYINGSKITSFGIATYPSIDFENSWNNTVSNYIGFNNYFDGYLTEIYNIDGQALTPSSFGETDAITGRWKAKAYSGTYGTNGFYLKFADNSSTAALGTDSSGNGNTWTTNNFQVSGTPASVIDSLVDSPTNYGSDTGAGGTLRGNYATLNPLAFRYAANAPTFSDGNLQITSNSGVSSQYAFSSIGFPNSGKFYYEVTISLIGASSSVVGVADIQLLQNSNFSNVIGYINNGQKSVNGTDTSYGATWTTGDIIGVAVNIDSQTITFYKNNTSQGSLSFNCAGLFPDSQLGISSASHIYNFGQRPFAYTAPTGFKALCTTNFTTPTIKKPSSYMDVVTYTGNGVTNSITGLGFSPDMVWLKGRSLAAHHRIYDTTRGVTKVIYPSLTDAEVTVPDANDNFVSFDSGGFTLGSTSGANGLNQNSQTFVAWAWDAGESSVTNNSGSITSTVRANPQDGVSIVSANYTSGTQSYGHGLGVKPAMYIVKNRNASQNWQIWHKSLSNETTAYLQFNTSGQQTVSNMWSPSTTTTISLATNPVSAGDNFMAYVFAEIEGFSKFGSYTGNGSADGPFVYCGFRPRWILVKNSSDVASWFTWDTARGIYNVDGSTLSPNASAAEDVNNSLLYIDELSNGFKIRSSYSGINTSSNTYIFAAFAEAPFKYARAR